MGCPNCYRLAATKHYLCCCHKVAQLCDLIHLVGAEHSGRLSASHATERALNQRGVDDVHR